MPVGIMQRIVADTASRDCVASLPPGEVNDCSHANVSCGNQEFRRVHSWHKGGLINELHLSSVRGIPYPSGVILYTQSLGIPNDVVWSLESHHDMFCGVYDSTGDRFFAGSHDGVVRIFDSSQRYFRLKEEILCPYHYWSVVSLVLSPNERFLAYSILTERVQLVRLGDGVTESKLAVLQASDNGSNVSKTFSVCFDGTGDRLIAGHNSGVIRVYDIHGPQCEQVQTVSDCGSSDLNAVTTVDITGHTILAGGDDTNIRLFDLRALNKGALAVFTGHFDGITYLDPKGDGCYFLSNSKDQTVRLWDMRKHTKPGKERQCRPRVAWDYRYHAIPESYLRQRHASSGSCRGDQSILTLRGHTVRFSLIRARFSPKHSTGQRFAYSGSASGAWHIWDLSTGKLTRTNSVGSESIRDVYWHPWEPLAIASGMDGSLTCWKYRREKGLDDKGSSPTSDHERFNNATDERAHFLSVDPRGERYSLRLAESGLRYRFPGEHLQILPSSDSGSSHSDLEDYHDEYLLASETDESTSNDSSYEGFLSGRCELASDDEEDPDFNINAFADSNSLPSTNSPSRMVTRSQSRPRGGTESIRRRAHLGRRSGTTGHSS